MSTIADMVKWTNRYSSSMEDDEIGRWARVAVVGNKDTFVNNRVARFDIAWIKKHVVSHKKGEVHFVVKYLFPSQGKHLFTDLEEAKKEVENCFEWFIKNCLQ